MRWTGQPSAETARRAAVAPGARQCPTGRRASSQGTLGSKPSIEFFSYTHLIKRHYFETSVALTLPSMVIVNIKSGINERK